MQKQKNILVVPITNKISKKPWKPERELQELSISLLFKLYIYFYIIVTDIYLFIYYCDQYILFIFHSE